MTLASRTSATALTALMLLAACSSSPSSEASEAASSGASAPAASIPGDSQAPVAGEPCSFLTAEEVGAIVGTTPVEVAERVGRGDCDYWLNAAKDAHVNIGVFTGSDNASLFEITKGIGDPQPVDNLGDDAYSIFNESIGTVVVVKQGDTTIIVQVFTADMADQLAQATQLAEAVLAKL